MKIPWIENLVFCVAIAGIPVAADSDPKQPPLIPTGINNALGSVRKGMTVDDVVKEFQVFYPKARWMEIVGGLAKGSVSINLGDGVEVGFQVMPSSDRNVWLVAETSPVWIQDYKRLQAIKVEILPIQVVRTEEAQVQERSATE